MKVLVTGASGFIGRRAVIRLAADGKFEVAASSRRPAALLPAGVAHEPADLLAPGVAAALINKVRPTHLLHLAWNAHPGQFWTALDNLDWMASTMSLLGAFIAAGGQRAVMAGSCAEYDWLGESRLSEQSPTDPATLYGIAKDATRRAACAGGQRFGVPVAWGRVFWLYGPCEPPGRLVSDVAAALAEGRPVDTTDGMQKRDFLHVEDVASAFVAALTSEWSGLFNIGSGHAVTVRHLIETLSRMLGRPDLVRFGARARCIDDPSSIYADTSVLQEAVGFTPTYTLDTGLQHTAEWWRGQVRRR